MRFNLLRLNNGARKGLIPAFPEGTSIPKILHQTALAPAYRNKALPQILSENVTAIRAMNPGWDYNLYDDADVVRIIQREYGSKILSYYERINEKYGAARADLFRYLLMYKYGGVYLDIKSSATFPFDEVLLPDDRFILSYWNREEAKTFEWARARELESAGGREFQQWHLVTVSGHPFLRAVIERVLYNIDHYLPAVHGVGSYGVLKVTGPIAYTLAIAPEMQGASYRLVDDNSRIGLRYSVYGSMSVHRQAAGHYAALKDPVIEVNELRQLISGCFGLAKVILRPIFRPKTYPKVTR
jgi:inositol phosphorylceramide mannosyltransferase catalytic subunit